MFDTGVPENLEQIQPGEELGRVLACLDFEHLPDYELIRVIQAQDRQIAHYQAGRAWSMNQIATRYQDRYADDTFEAHEAVDGAAAEIAAALHLTRRSAEDQTGFALGLVRHRPKVFEALLFGRIDLYRAKILVQATLHLTDAAADMVLEEILPRGASQRLWYVRHPRS